MNPVLMRTENDCEIAALATATGKTYEEAEAAFSGLPAVDPIRGNPESLYAALIRLGFWKRNITWEMLQNHQAEPGKTVILIHNPERPTLSQHWIVIAEYSPDGFRCFWGCSISAGHDATQPVNVSAVQMKSLFLRGWPNCAFQVTTGTVFERFKRWIGL